MKYYLDKQELYNPKDEKKEEVFTYTNIVEVDDYTESRNLMIWVEVGDRIWYAFIYQRDTKLETLNGEQMIDQKEMFFPIVQGYTTDLTYCEVTYEQVLQFLNQDRLEYLGLEKVIEEIKELHMKEVVL